MNTLDAENYCELIAIHSKKISQKVEQVRYENAKKISRTNDYKDGTANQAADNLTELYSVDVVIDGEKITLGYPERWIKVLALTHKRYRQRFGDDWALTMRYRYVLNWEPTKCYVYQGISRRSFGNRRSEFLKMLALYAIQNKLISVE